MNIYNINDLIKQLSKRISIHDSWLLLETITNKNKTQLLANEELKFTEQQKNQIEQWLQKIIHEHMPIQYLVGHVPFGDLTIFVEPPILIPRPETEHWVYELIEKLKKLQNKKISILDIGTGSGCIAIALAKTLPDAQVYAIDISQKALSLAKKNIKFNNIENIELIQSDLFENLESMKFDLIVSNPPYIDEKFFKTLDLSVKNWEDQRALICKDSGLEIIKKIIEQAHNYLKINNEFSQKNLPQLVLEIDCSQGQQVSNLLKENKFSNIKVQKDLAGRDRVVTSGE